MSQILALTALENSLMPHLDSLIPDWKALVDFVPATEMRIDAELIEDTLKQSDTNKLLAIERGIQRNTTVIKHKIREEEENLSRYAV